MGFNYGYVQYNSNSLDDKVDENFNSLLSLSNVGKVILSHILNRAGIIISENNINVIKRDVLELKYFGSEYFNLAWWERQFDSINYDLNKNSSLLGFQFKSFISSEPFTYGYIYKLRCF